MIISASRRTDIPAFYSKWFLNRIRAGFCLVPKPFNPDQVSNVSLKPDNVDLFVFWTRNPGPIIPHLKELDMMGYSYYFLYTLMDNPRILDPKSPSFEASLETFRKLSDLTGPEKIIWRYDPIVISNYTGIDFHKKTFDHISTALRGHTFRCIISFVDFYRKIKGRIDQISNAGFVLEKCDDNDLSDLAGSLSVIAGKNEIELTSCASKFDLTGNGVTSGKCIDDIYISKLLGKKPDIRKDPSQRKNCGCILSKDIGMYDSCLSRCVYCYATTSFERAKINYKRHDPDLPSLIPLIHEPSNP